MVFGRHRFDSTTKGAPVCTMAGHLHALLGRDGRVWIYRGTRSGFIALRIGNPRYSAARRSRNKVAQSCTLPYRRFAIGWPFGVTHRLTRPSPPQNTILRYSAIQQITNLRYERAPIQGFNARSF